MDHKDFTSLLHTINVHQGEYTERIARHFQEHRVFKSQYFKDLINAVDGYKPFESDFRIRVRIYCEQRLAIEEHAEVEEAEKERLQNSFIRSSIQSSHAVMASVAQQETANRNQKTANDNQESANENQRSANRNTKLIGIATVIVAAASVIISILSYFKNDDRLNLQPIIDKQERYKNQVNQLQLSLDSTLMVLSVYRDSIDIIRSSGRQPDTIR